MVQGTKGTDVFPPSPTVRAGFETLPCRGRQGDDVSR